MKRLFYFEGKKGSCFGGAFDLWYSIEYRPIQHTVYMVWLLCPGGGVLVTLLYWLGCILKYSPTCVKRLERERDIHAPNKLYISDIYFLYFRD